MARKEDVKWAVWEDVVLHQFACKMTYTEIAKMLDNKTAKDCIKRRVDYLYTAVYPKIKKEEQAEMKRERAERLKKLGK